MSINENDAAENDPEATDQLETAADSDGTEPTATVQEPYPNKRYFFPQSDYDKVQELIELATANDLAVHQFDGEFTEDAMIAVLPIGRRETQDDGEKKDILYHIVVWPVYTMSAVIKAHPREAEDAIFGVQANRIMQGVKAKDFTKGTLDLSKVPNTLATLMVSGDKARYKSYNEVVKPILDRIKEHALFKHLNAAGFRDLCASKALAQSATPKLEEIGLIVRAIEHMKSAAASKSLPVTIFDEWLETRNEVTFDEVDEMDLSELSFDD